MPVVSVGDMSQQFISMRNSGAIKTELARLSNSLSSGQIDDVTAAMNGDTVRLSGLNYTLAQLDGYGQAATETKQILSNIQSVLGQVDALRQQSSAQLLLVNDESTVAQVDEAARSGRQTFDVMVATLNKQVADRSLLGGSAVSNAPLATAEVMLSDIEFAIGGATTFLAIETVVNTWFDDPAGGFATVGYAGDTGPLVERRISETSTVSIDARADNPAVVATLKSAAMAALADRLPVLDQGVRSELLQAAGEGLFAASSGLVAMQARVGSAEMIVETTQTEMTARASVLGAERNDLVLADPFETASQLQSVQLQLETHFTVTARLSQLSLLRYI